MATAASPGRPRRRRGCTGDGVASQSPAWSGPATLVTVVAVYCCSACASNSKRATTKLALGSCVEHSALQQPEDEPTACPCFYCASTKMQPRTQLGIIGAEGRAKQSAGRTARLKCRRSFSAGAVARQHPQVFPLLAVIIQLQAKHNLSWCAGRLLLRVFYCEKEIIYLRARSCAATTAC